MLRLLTALLCLTCAAPLAAQSLQRLRQQADSLYSGGDFAGALAAFEQLAETFDAKGQPDSLRHYRLKVASCEVQMGAFDAAQAHLRQLLAEKPYPLLAAKAAQTLSLAYAQVGEADSAMFFIEQSLAVQTDHNLGDTLLLGKCHDLKAFLHLQRNEAQAARTAIDEAHALRTAFLDPLDLELGYGANSRYLVLDAIGDPAGARDAAEEAWRILNHNLPPDHPHLAVIANNLSVSRADMGDAQGARFYLQQAIASNEAGGRSRLLMENYFNLAYLYVKLEDWANAQTYNRRALALGDSLLDRPDDQYADMLEGLGATYFGASRYATADSVLLLALQERQAYYDVPHTDLASSWYALGLSAHAQEKNDLARSYLSQAESLHVRLSGKFSGKWADVTYELAELNWREGHEEEARQQWRQTLAIYREMRGPAHAHTLENLHRLAEAFFFQNQLDSTRSYLEQAWRVLGLKPGGPEAQIEPLVPPILDLIELQLRLGLREKETLEGPDWQRYHELATAWLAWLPDYLQLFPPGSQQADRRGKVQGLYRWLGWLAHEALAAAAQPEREAWQTVLLQAMQAVRGSSIRAALQRRQAMQFAGVPDSLVQQGERLEEQLRFLYQSSQTEAEAVDPQQRTAAFEAWQAYQRRLRRAYPGYHQARYARPDLNPRLLQASLGGEALLAYLYLDSALLVLRVTPQELESQYLPLSPGWDDSLKVFLTLLRQPRLSPQQTRLAQTFYQQLWQPVAKDLPETVRILPDGPLYTLNFELLLTAEPAAGAPRPYLLRQHALYYAHQFLPAEAVTGQAGEGVLGIAPGFTAELKARYQQQLAAQQAPDSLFLRWLSTPWSLEFVEGLARRGWGKALTGLQATEAAVLSEAPQAAILHFGTHARLQNDDPLMSFLVLTPDPEGAFDGYLHTYELYQQLLPARLAVLTACETGLGPYQPGEGLLSLAHGFRYAGCPSVVHSLWSIDDEQSQRLLEAFYAALQAGEAPAEALRQAKLVFLETAEGGLAAPYFWGGLVLTGENEGVGGKSGPWLWWGLGLLVLVGVLAGALLRKRNFSSPRMMT